MCHRTHSARHREGISAHGDVLGLDVEGKGVGVTKRFPANPPVVPAGKPLEEISTDPTKPLVPVME